MKTKALTPADKVEMHLSGRAGWLRAAVLGSDDAIVSTASLMVGVAAASASQGAILVAGVAGLVAGAMSMAVGEYVSVSSERALLVLRCLRARTARYRAWLPECWSVGGVFAGRSPLSQYTGRP